MQPETIKNWIEAAESKYFIYLFQYLFINVETGVKPGTARQIDQWLKSSAEQQRFMFDDPS